MVNRAITVATDRTHSLRRVFVYEKIMASKKSSTQSRSNGSYSYTKPVTEKSAGTKGDFVAGNSERVGDNFHRRLGLTPNRKRSDSSSTPLPSRFKGQ